MKSKETKEFKKVVREFCNNCYFWQAIKKTRRGKCRVKPPVINFVNSLDDYEASWPQTLPEDWCGDYKCLVSYDEKIEKKLYENKDKKLTLKQWSEVLEINYELLRERVTRRDWDFEEAVAEATAFVEKEMKEEEKSNA